MIKPPPDLDRCMYAKSDGRRCTHERMEGFPMCLYHWRQGEEKAAEHAPLSAAVADELLPAEESLSSARAVNDTLTRLFRMVAQRRIPKRDAQILAYLGQLAVSTLPQLQKETVAGPQHPILGANPGAAIESLARSFDSMVTNAKSALADAAATPPLPDPEPES